MSKKLAGTTFANAHTKNGCEPRHGSRYVEISVGWCRMPSICVSIFLGAASYLLSSSQSDYFLSQLRAAVASSVEIVGAPEERSDVEKFRHLVIYVQWQIQSEWMRAFLT